MNEKTCAVLVTTLLITPLVALCCLGPIVLVSLLSGIGASLGGLGTTQAAGVAIAAGIFVYAFHRLRRSVASRAHAPDGAAKPASTSALKIGNDV